MNSVHDLFLLTDRHKYCLLYTSTVVVPSIYKDCIAIPQTATVRMQDKTIVYKVVDGKAVSTLITCLLYTSQAASATRTVKIVNDKDLVVMDEIKARTDKSAKVRWCMVTPAVPTVESNRIVLTNGSKEMCIRDRPIITESRATGTNIRPTISN